MEIPAKIAKDFQSLNVFAKTPSQKSGRLPNICYKITVRKFPSQNKSKQKKDKKDKN